jgi:phosphatidylserine/phosphatidylglycerophosphate/cardiolipin synthase-like enzyme
MKNLIRYKLFFLFLAVFCSVSYSFDLTLTNAPTQVYFSPYGGCTQAIVKEIDNAKSDIYVQAYSFTSKPIANALVAAFNHGVKVEIILDKSQRSGRYSLASFFANAKIPTYIDDKYAIAHNKIIIVDEETVITGSFNFTKAAEEKNAENLLIIKSKKLAALYLENWKKHKEHSWRIDLR